MRPRMIHFIVFFAFFVFSVFPSQAALLGIEGQLGYPDILFSDGTIKYSYYQDSRQGIFSLEATDLILTYSEQEEYYLSGTNYVTKMYVDVKVTIDGSGRPILGAGEMREIVVEGTVFIGNKLYLQGTTLLSGTISAFGWGEGDDLGKFDFLIVGLGGKLIEDSLWPGHYPVGMCLEALNLHGWNGSWMEDFKLTEATGDKAPIPIPASLVLLSSGLGLLRIFGLKRNGPGR